MALAFFIMICIANVVRCYLIQNNIQVPFWRLFLGMITFISVYGWISFEIFWLINKK